MLSGRVMMKTDQIKLVVILLCSLFSTSAPAEKWYWEPVFSARTGYDDNIRLEVDDAEGLFDSHLSADARFGFRTEVSDVKFQTALKTHQYDGAGDLNYNEALFGVDASLRHELDTFGVDASVLRDSSRTSELDTTGSVATSIPRIKAYISPSWSRELSETSQLRLSYAFTDVDYQNKSGSLLSSGTNLTDYRYENVNIELNKNLSETTDLQTILFGNRYKTIGRYSKSESIGLQVGISRRFNETLSGSLALGVNHIDTFYLNSMQERDEASDIAPLIAISFNKVWERMSLRGSFASSQSPGGEGRLLNSNSTSLEFTRKLSERLNFALNGIYTRNETAGGVRNTGDSRTYFSIEPRLSWQASRWWTISGSYRYRSQEYTETNGGLADSNAVYLSVEYVWPRPSYDRWMEL